jgi:hypothetical protein
MCKSALLPLTYRFFRVLLLVVSSALLWSCGGGNDTATPSESPTPEFLLSIDSLRLQPGFPATVTVLSGVRPFSVTSENPGVLPVPSVIEATTLVLQASLVSAVTTIKVVITDGKGRSKTVTAIVEPPAPLSVIPADLRMYSEVPASLTVVNGVMPIRAVSSVPGVISVPAVSYGAVIPLTAATVTTLTPVVITLVDATGRSQNVNVNVDRSISFQDASIIPPQPTKCVNTQGNVVCSGETALLRTRVLTPNGGPISGREVRAEVILGEFGFATPQGSIPQSVTATSATDQAGYANFRLAANLLIDSQVAVVRLTDLSVNNILDFPFSLVRAVGVAPGLSVVPQSYTVTGFYQNECAAATFDLILFGGSPPYRLTGTLPTLVLLSTPSQTTPSQTVVVSASGGTARVTVRGVDCSGPIQSFVNITDQTGQSIVATLSSAPGTAQRPAAGSASQPVFASSAFSADCRVGLPRTIPLSISGGTAPYVVNTNQPTTVTASASGLAIKSPGLPAGTRVTITAVDAKNVAASSTLTCQ